MKHVQIANDIEQRLQSIPRKVAGRLRGLLQLEHIDESTINTILDAAELARDTTFLADFATGYLYLRSQAVPVADVINMAKQHDRRIHLMWSGARWKEEHDRLSRYATLKSLSENRITYDTSWADDALAEFPGYVIGSSHRLGMEGLRQKHCVASYHHRIQMGSTLIAAVFFERKRWTVELIRLETTNSIRIGQIKTRYNANPSPVQRREITEMLGIPNNETSMSTGQRGVVDGEPSWRACLRILIPVLQEQGVASVGVSFSGYGDSGAIDELVTHDQNDQPVSLRGDITYPKQRTVWSGGYYETQIDQVTESLEDALNSMVYDWLDNTNVDWYNNEGGQGELTIDLVEGLVDGYVDYNIQEAERGHTEEIGFDEILYVDADVIVQT